MVMAMVMDHGFMPATWWIMAFCTAYIYAAFCCCNLQVAEIKPPFGFLLKAGDVLVIIGTMAMSDGNLRFETDRCSSPSLMVADQDIFCNPSSDWDEKLVLLVSSIWFSFIMRVMISLDSWRRLMTRESQARRRQRLSVMVGNMLPVTISSI